MVIVRHLRENELSVLKDFTPPHWAGNVFDTFCFHFEKSYFYPFVAEIDGKIVGCAYGLQNGKSGWLSTLIVLPEYRGSGIASELLKVALDFLLHKGCSNVHAIAASKTSEFIFSKLGFVESSTYTRLYRERPIAERLITKFLRWKGNRFYDFMPSYFQDQVPWKPTPFVRKVNSSDHERILNIDREVTGEDRKVFLEQYLSGGWVYQAGENEPITGFYLEGFANNPIMALDSQAGLGLLQFKVGRGSQHICVPSVNYVAIEFLIGIGFSICETQPRMTFGPEVNWFPQGVFNRGGGTG